MLCILFFHGLSEPPFAFQVLGSRRSKGNRLHSLLTSGIKYHHLLFVVNLPFSPDGLCWIVTKIKAALLQRSNDTDMKKWLRLHISNFVYSTAGWHVYYFFFKFLFDTLPSCDPPREDILVFGEEETFSTVQLYTHQHIYYWRVIFF